MLVLCAIAGATALGFMGIGIEACAEYTVTPSYVCSLIEFIVNAVGGTLNYVTGSRSGFDWVAGISLVAMLLLLGYRRAPPHSQEQPSHSQEQIDKVLEVSFSPD